MLVALAATLAIAAAASSPGAYVIAAGQETLVGQLLAADALPAHCHFQGASIQPTQIDGRFTCQEPTRTVVVHLQHPKDAPNASVQTNQFAIVADTNAPAELAPALAQHIRSREASWRWSNRAETPRKTEPIAANDTPRPPDRIPTTPRFGATIQFERFLFVLFLLIGLRSFVTYPFTRALSIRAGALFVVSLAIRCIVPWVPANFYSDLATPFANFRHNTTYVHPFYDAIFHMIPSPDAPFCANVVLGSLIPPILFLALQAGPGDSHAAIRGLDKRAALPFAASIALFPFFVRLSASEAPHVFGLFAFAMGALFFARAFSTGSRLEHAGFLIAAYLVGATRRELAIGPLMYLFLAFGWYGRGVLRRAHITRCVGVVFACGFGLFFTHLNTTGQLNSDVELSWAQLVIYAQHWPAALQLPGESVPLLLRIGLLVLLVDSLWRRQWFVPLAYLVGMTLFTLPYATERSFVHAYDQPISIWSFSRYALVWYLFPTYFGILGAFRIFERKWFLTLPFDRIFACGLLVANTFPLYFLTYPYQEEYRFLRRFLLRDTTNLPVVTSWQKYAGVDFCESLAQPFFALSGIHPNRRFIVLGEHDITTETLLGMKEKFYYFSNTLPQIHEAPVTAEGNEVAELSRALRAFRTMDCLAKRHGQPVISETMTMGKLQFSVGLEQKVTLGVYLVEPPTNGWDLNDCPGNRNDVP